MEDHQLVSPLRQCSSTAIRFGQGFLSKEQHNITGAIKPYSPDLSPSDFYLFSRLKSALKGWRFRDAADVIKNGTKELKSLPGMLPVPLQPLSEVYSCTRGLFLRNCSLNDCIVLYVSEIKRFREYFEAITHLAPLILNLGTK